MKIFPLSYNSWTETSEMILDRDLRGTFEEVAEVIATILEKHTGHSVHATRDFDEVCQWGYESTGNLAGLFELMLGIVRTYETRFTKNFETSGWKAIILALMIQYSTIGKEEVSPTDFPILIKTDKTSAVVAYRQYYNQRPRKYSSCYKPSWTK